MEMEQPERIVPEYDGTLIECMQCDYHHFMKPDYNYHSDDCPRCDARLEYTVLYRRTTVRTFLKQFRDEILGCEHACDEYKTLGFFATCTVCDNRTEITELAIAERIESFRGV